MDKTLAMIVLNDYATNDREMLSEEKMLNKLKVSKATYYRRKRIALDEFILFYFGRN